MKADILSRKDQVNTKEDNKNVQLLKKEDGLTWEEDGVVYMEERIYIPNNKKIKEEILKKNHNLGDVGHPGQHRMLELLERMYWWPGLKEDVKKYVQECFKCQQNKVQHQRKTGELHPLEIPKGPCQEISIDIIGLLPKSNGMDTIVVIVDQFTKMIRLKATTMNISSEGITKIYRDDIWKLHGIPRKILSDRGPQFAS